MKTELSEIQRLFTVRSDRRENIQSWDIDNGFPQRCMWLSEKSVTASSCIDLFGQFLYGEGWIDRAFADQVVGPNEMTMDDLGEEIFKEYAQHRGFALQVSLNGLMEHVSYQVIPIDMVRKGDGKKENMYAFHNHWGKIPGKKFNSKDIQWYHSYTEDKNKILEYIQEDGGFDEFRGLLYFFSIDRLTYPTPKFSAAIEDVETEALISIFNRRNAATGFMASHIFKFTEEFETQEEEDEMRSMIEKFQGSNNAMKILQLYGVDEDGMNLEIEKVDIQDVDRLFEHTEESCANKIRNTFLTPKILIGQEEATGFDTERLKDARAYYNSVVIPDRNKVIKALKKVVRNFERPLIPQSWDIKELYSDDIQAENENTNGSN